MSWMDKSHHILCFKCQIVVHNSHQTPIFHSTPFTYKHTSYTVCSPPSFLSILFICACFYFLLQKFFFISFHFHFILSVGCASKEQWLDLQSLKILLWFYVRRQMERVQYILIFTLTFLSNTINSSKRSYLTPPISCLLCVSSACWLKDSTKYYSC